jgi:hypothetical protein
MLYSSHVQKHVPRPEAHAPDPHAHQPPQLPRPPSSLPLFGHIKAEFNLTDYHLGILATVFIVVHSLAVFPLGVLG